MSKICIFIFKSNKKYISKRHKTSYDVITPIYLFPLNKNIKIYKGVFG